MTKYFFVCSLFLSCLALAGPPAERISGRVVLLRDGQKADPKGVVVYLDGLEATPEPVAGKQVVQQDLKFSPATTVVTVGSTVEFPNLDRVFHNVFSLSRAARFDLGIYRDGDSKSVTFKKPGTVDLFCNIHPQMVAKILVVPTRFYVAVGADGAFTFEGVPPGPTTVIAWQQNGEATRLELTAESSRQELVLELKAVDGSVRHLRKDGTPYGRYK